MGLNETLFNAVVRFLTGEIRNYQRRIPNHLERFKKHARPGDVVLVEGKTRIAQIIKVLTQSSWSHSTLYVGDRLVSGDHQSGLDYRELYGEGAHCMLIEADLANGVSAVPVTKYQANNLRVCRPYAITPDDLEKLLDEVISRIGESYDAKHLLDLARYLTPFPLVPWRWRRKAFFSGRSESRPVICSSLIARAFLNIRYPILPRVSEAEEATASFPYGRRFRSLHPSLALPRDFDLSPYFRVVKFNVIEEGPIDYRMLDWETGDSSR